MDLIISKFSALENCQNKMLPFIAHLTRYKFNYLLTVIMSAKFITTLKTLFLLNYEDRTFNLGVLENTLVSQTYVPMAAFGPRVCNHCFTWKTKSGSGETKTQLPKY